ncbi:MAG: hypothetical protein LBG29_01500 [Synergistaceae bacterium]|nr:hypothetical protein [Synergistaceae bacterium]
MDVYKIYVTEETSRSAEDLSAVMKERMLMSNASADTTDSARSIRTEIIRLGSYDWVKTVTTYTTSTGYGDHNGGTVYYQTITDDSSYYVVIFRSQLYFPSYEPAFDKLMRSFKHLT